MHPMQNNWITHPTILKGEQIELHPLEKEHFDALFSAAADEELWRLIPTDCSRRETFDQAYNIALTERDKGNQYPFVIHHKESKELIGSTRLFEIFPADKKLEIGWTWLIKKHWDTSINLECKLLLLTHCFEVLKTRRVQLKTDVNNLRSRKAIEKTGAEFEGILRKDKIKANGVSRSAAYYSIIDDEWEFAKTKIKSQLQEKRGG
jgi:RimJ/RimL family protein N-acetyltransferase